MVITVLFPSFCSDLLGKERREEEESDHLCGFWCCSFFTENATDFTVLVVIGPSGVGKSTILNEVYYFDMSSPEVFAID